MAWQSEPLTVSALRDAERITLLHTPESLLMDRAAAAIASQAAGASRVALLIGRGNNGGDALLAGAQLAGSGVSVTAVLLAPDAHQRGLATFTAAGGQVVEWEIDLEAAIAALVEADLIVDGIVGLGAQAGLRAVAQAAVRAILPGTPILAVDIPSGLDPDSGDARAPHVIADVTVTFTAPKVCLTLEPAAASAGRVVIADVGVDL